MPRRFQFSLRALLVATSLAAAAAICWRLSAAEGRAELFWHGAFIVSSAAAIGTLLRRPVGCGLASGIIWGLLVIRALMSLRALH